MAGNGPQQAVAPKDYYYHTLILRLKRHSPNTSGNQVVARNYRLNFPIIIFRLVENPKIKLILILNDRESNKKKCINFI